MIKKVTILARNKTQTIKIFAEILAPRSELTEAEIMARKLFIENQCHDILRRYFDVREITVK